MSLANENDLIIPGIVGIISAAANAANILLDEYRGHIHDKNKNIAKYIGKVPKIHYTLQNRINGVPLNQLVTPTRISNDATRSVAKQGKTDEKKPRAYEPWFRE